ncbi:MAG: hypothetical protein K5651_01855 [Bacteroidales bacterium]|nr:hypothetical protein [Bacteroidales bacterium]
MIVEDWVFNEVIDTLHMAQVALLGITGLDSSDEIRRKSIKNESATTRRIERAIKLATGENIDIYDIRTQEVETKDGPMFTVEITETQEVQAMKQKFLNHYKNAIHEALSYASLLGYPPQAVANDIIIISNKEVI